ncbi:MAG: hypothetical protein UY63_C0017G0011 [Parcubacteria group bacterium GW2011_GWA2_51_10]|nr:MAG: hypothetical protein UY63_C0017G0011 [Parcubacteria group bacterium GW2011_GWA2_51_10]
MSYKLSPSDFGYLLGDCKHCYYSKVKLGLALPSMPFPGIFARMNSLLQSHIVGMNMRNIHPDLPDVIVESQEGWLKSTIIPSSDCYISGRFDILCRTPSGEHTVIDFKIIDSTQEKILQRYGSQLHAYKFAFENPQEGEPRKVQHMGIVTLSPQSVEIKEGRAVFTSQPQYFEVKEDMQQFFRLIEEISGLLSGVLPTATSNCAWCKYKKLVREQN